MKKFSTISVTAIAILSFYTSLFAQTETDTTFAAQMNYIFAHVDKTKVPNTFSAVAITSAVIP